MPEGLTETHADTLLSRIELASALTRLGFKISPGTLASMATRGGGPPFRKSPNRVLYRWGDALAWAQGRLSKVVNSTSELRKDEPLHAA